MSIRITVGLLFAAAVLVAEQSVSITPASVTPDGVLVSTVRHDNRDALRLIEVDNKRGGGMAMVNGQTFRDGTIEIDVAGRRGPVRGA